MKRTAVIIAFLLLFGLTLTACEKSEFTVDGSTDKHMTITAKNADKDAFVMVGTLEVDNGEKIEIASDLEKGQIKVEIVRASDDQSKEKLPDLDGEAAITATAMNDSGATGTVPAGSYLLRATVLEKATGTVEIRVE